MKYLGKYIIGLLGMVFLLAGGISFVSGEGEQGEVGQGEVRVRGQGEVASNTPPSAPCTIENQVRNPLGICKCPPGTTLGKDEDLKATCVPCSNSGVCCGIKLNTKVPFIGNCIEFSQKDVACTKNDECPGGTCENEKCVFPKDSSQTTVSETEAFPVLMGSLIKILVTVILLMGFIGVLAGGIMISASGDSDTRASQGKKLIGKVIVAFALLGASGVILRLINPNFFG